MPHVPELSIVIATYNRSSRITKLLDDIFGQDLPLARFEVIVVNDGSRDDTQARLDSYAAHLASLSPEARLVLLHQENGGQAVARQAGTEVSQGGVLLFLDDDMRLPRTNFLASHLRRHALENEGKPLVVLGKMIPPCEASKRNEFEYFYEKSLARMAHMFEKGTMIPRGQHLFTGNVSLTRSAFVACGGFSSRFKHAEDKELGLRLEARTGARFVFEPEALSVHHSDTPSFTSFTNRAFHYGRFDCEIQALYPTRPEIGPAAVLVPHSPYKSLLCRLLLGAPWLRRVVSSGFIAAAKGFGFLNLRSPAALCCSFVYLANYISGVVEAKGSARAVASFLRPYAPPAFGTQLKGDLQGILDYEKRRVSLGNILWALFGIDAFVILFFFRLRQLAARWKIPLLGRLLRGLCGALYGIELGIDVKLGTGVYFVHPQAVVIGGSARIGDRCVFMGSNTVGTAKDNGYPTLENGVRVGAGARILGPITIGENSTIGANAVVLDDVPPQAVMVGIPARMVRR